MRLKSIDGIRFLSAVWVAVFHLGLGQYEYGPAKALAAALTPMFCGAAAVMVFFVISGICIHLPYARGKEFEAQSFWLSRISRVALPTLAAIALSATVPGGYARLKGVLWSLVCEVGYYAVYPALRVVIARHGISRTMAAAYALAVAVLAVRWDAPGHGVATMGLFSSAVYGLPVWLSGCWIAERLPSAPEVSRIALVGWRVAALAGGAAAWMANAHTPVWTRYTMLPYSIVAARWLAAELSQTRPQRFYERLSTLGQATFSIYLCHMISLPLAELAGAHVYLVVVGLSAAFYALVERPTHKLSRWLGSRKRQSSGVAVAAS